VAFMAKARDGEKEFKLVPAGAHTAICNMVVDVGLQQTGFGAKHKVYFRFELPGERVEWEKDGEKHEGPMSIGNFYTVSLSQKANLRSFLESWRGKPFTKDELAGFDLFNVLGAPCILNVVHNKNEDTGKTYANIKAIMPLPKGVTRPKPENPILKYSPDSAGDLEKLPEWLRDKIAKQMSPTPDDEPTPGTDAEFKDDDLSGVPF